MEAKVYTSEAKVYTSEAKVYSSGRKQFSSWYVGYKKLSYKTKDIMIWYMHMNMFV